LHSQEVLVKKSPFTEIQVVATLEEAAAGVRAKDVCCKYDISEPPYDNWKSTYGRMETCDLKRMKAREGELSQLKRRYADLALKNLAMKDRVAKSCNVGRQTRCGRLPERCSGGDLLG
jgi:putative transposase